MNFGNGFCEPLRCYRSNLISHKAKCMIQPRFFLYESKKSINAMGRAVRIRSIVAKDASKFPGEREQVCGA